MAVKQEKKVVLLSQLKENADNPMMHPEEQIAALAKSIEKYGQYYPIVTDENLNILAGHGKKKALERLGRDKADVIVMTGLSEKDKKKLLLEDNKIQSLSFARYDMIDKIIREIGEPDIIGFNEDYLQAIINEGKPELQDIVDNAGAKLTVKPKQQSDEERTKDIPEDVQEGEEEEYDRVSAGMEQARTIICPHCGKEIVL